MSWQMLVIAQVVVSSVLAITTRKISLVANRAFFSMGFFMYMMIAIMGAIFSIAHTGAIPPLPPQDIWLAIGIESIAIPISWMLSYAILRRIGASNMAIVTILGTLAIAMSGVVFLNEPLSPTFAIGTALIVASTYISLRIKPDVKTKKTGNMWYTILLAICFTLAIAVAIFFERNVISHITAWHYSLYGWTGQFIGITILLLLFGRKELRAITRKTAWLGTLLGFTTSIAGLLFILALQFGTLSGTILATSGKVALTMILAAIFLHERNAPIRRILAFVLSVAGLWLILL